MLRCVFLTLTIPFLLKCRVVRSAAIEKDGSRLVFDQRQSGKYNIHVSIKDVAIVELDRNDFKETNSDPDYYYDDGDFTIKPLLALYQSINNSTHSTTENISVTPVGLIHETINPTFVTSLTATPTTSALPSTPTILQSQTTKKVPSVMVLKNIKTIEKNQQANEQSGLHENGDKIPVHIIIEPVLMPRLRAPSERIKHKVNHVKQTVPVQILGRNSRPSEPENRRNVEIQQKIYNPLLKSIFAILSALPWSESD